MAIFRGIGGSLDGQTETISLPVAISQGGTGQTDANKAFNALAPNQTSKNGRYLKTDGTNTSWDDFDISTADINGVLPVTNGGTGASDVTTARDNLGLEIGVDIPATNGTGATGTWAIDVSGNAATVTNGIYTSGSYSNPSWLVDVDYSKLTGTVPTWNQNTTGTALNVTGTVAVANGGTGATTAANARVGLLPSYTGNGNKVLALNAGATDVEWTAAGSGAGDVAGPSSATDNAVARFDSTTGKLLQNSVVTIGDTGQIAGVLQEDFTATTAPSYSEGRVWYDSTEKALAFYNDSSALAVHVGQDLIVKVINNTGSTIPNGSPVYVTSTSSGQTYPNVALAKADVAATASVIGLTNGAIANGAIGYVTSQGTIDNVNTGTFTVGQVLYLSPFSAGQLMNTIPPTGITVQVGVATFINSSTGHIYVKQTTPLAVPASIITGSLPIANGGTGATTRQDAMDALAGSTTSGQYLRGNGTDVVMSTIQAGDVPTLNQNTTGSAATLTTGRTVAITGDLAYTSGSFDGSGNVTGTGTLATVNSNVGAFGSSTAIPVVTVNAKGLVTAVSTATVAGGQYFGSAATKAIAYNSNSIAENVTVTSGNNGLSAGPITISGGFAVTVASGSRWVVL